MRLKQGSVVLVDFSYSNLKEAKFRPALVISNSEYNEESIDIVLLRITSRGRDRKWDLIILKDDVAEGTIDIEPSFVKIDSLYTVEKNIVRKVVARLKEGKIEEIKQQLLELFS
ncbi:MAG: type II toxin-antitoxin system PemK/MazF family toxin [Candidatus Methanoperedens sp.]|nr:type II toxin-antitoxin system PemK/MazF family toxin [Candidatus Methanoperedens sp.]